MKKVVDDVRLMIKVCDLYYNQNISQQQISALLKISRPTISRLLTAAKESGIVKITVSDLDSVKHWELESSLENLYGLREVVIVDDAPSEEELKERLGRIGGRLLSRAVRDDSVVGVSMGTTLRQVVSFVEDPVAENVTFVPLIGGMGQLRMDLHSNSLAEELARKFDGKFIPLHAPARVSSALVRAELMKEESLASALSMGTRLDVAIVGIGYPSEKSAIKATGYYKENEIDSLIERGVAGEICMQFFNENGDTSPYINDNNVIGLELKKLRKVPFSIGIAGGIEKLSAIQGAIRGKYINALITDFECANALKNSFEDEARKTDSIA